MATETDTRRIALISDVHGNLPAFQAVLRAIEEEGVDGIWCLGDLVGYGAQPNECVELAERSVDLCLIGNHDLVVIDRLDITDFSANAAAAAEWTKEELGSEARAYLEKLDPADEEQALGLYHASPRDPSGSTCSPRSPRTTASTRWMRASAPWGTPTWRSRSGARASGRRPVPSPSPTPRLDISEDRWLINPGSVGQPRDGDPRASWVLLELELLARHVAAHGLPDRRRRGCDPGGRAAEATCRPALLRRNDDERSHHASFSPTPPCPRRSRAAAATTTWATRSRRAKAEHARDSARRGARQRRPGPLRRRRARP